MATSYAVRIVYRDGRTRLVGPFASKTAARGAAPTGGAGVVSTNVVTLRGTDAPGGAARILSEKRVGIGAAPETEPEPEAERLGAWYDDELGAGSSQGGAVQIIKDANGRYMVVGRVNDGTDHSAVGIWRFTIDGDLHTAWGGTGLVSLDSGDFDQARAVAVDSVGAVFVLYNVNEDSNLRLVKYTANGSLDTSWADSGFLVIASDAYAAFTGLAIEADDSLVVGYSSNAGDGTVLRFPADGNIGGNFVSLGSDRYVYGFAKVADGQYLVGLHDGNGNARYRALVDLDAETVDESDPISDITLSSSLAAVPITPGPAGDAFIGGADTRAGQNAAIVRVTAAGVIAEWGDDGIGTVTVDGFSSAFETVVWDGSNFVYGAGSYNEDSLRGLIGCFNVTTGLPKASFGTAGVVQLPLGDSVEGTYESVIQSMLVDGENLVVAGFAYRTATDASTAFVARINGDGGYDMTFGLPT